MKIDHLVMNIDKKYQKNAEYIEIIHSCGLPYKPEWGKGTRGFKASNIWIGREYFELISLLKKNGGGWKSEWVNLYCNGHRGLVCLMLDVPNIQQTYENIKQKGLTITHPEYLKFKWGMGLFTRTMPWMNSYFDFFEGVPVQIGLQQMKDQKSEDFMCQYMVPNARDNGITGIEKITIYGKFSDNDFKMIDLMFSEVDTKKDIKNVYLYDGKQSVCFVRNTNHSVLVQANGPDEYKGNKVSIENLTLEII